MMKKMKMMKKNKEHADLSVFPRIEREKERA
jgi:hypothetical protein